MADGTIDLKIPYQGKVAAVVIAVAHEEYRAAGGSYFSEIGGQTYPVLDLKHIFPDEPDFISL